MSVTDRPQNKPVIAIDGPAGAGKSTIAKMLATKLGFRHVDTGALYRGVAYIADKLQVDLSDEQAVVEAGKKANFAFQKNGDAFELHINGESVGDQIRTEQVSRAASQVSAYAGVRALLLGLQRRLGQTGASVLEGRDIGTVVFPDAEVKIFLTASVQSRAERRVKDLEGRGEQADLAEVSRAIADRDQSDMNREHAPLKKADDAIEVDTSDMSIQQVLDRLAEIVEQKVAR